MNGAFARGANEPTRVTHGAQVFQDTRRSATMGGPKLTGNWNLVISEP